MSITREDILGVSRFEPREKQFEMYEYWDGPYQEDPRLKSPLDIVTEYHREANLPVSQGMNKVECRFRRNLIIEEFGELHDEMIDYEVSGVDNKTEMLKEMADLVYVIYGTAVTFGWNLDEAVRLVHENNLGRMTQPDGTIKRRSDGKIIKNKEFPKVDLSGLV